ncbi:MAG: hypothetical protein HKN25_15615 [Pyrinomonadaceae bacterium]|nr:hypothetical protein [Pyrinomonadaceae bacterium]
MNRFDKNRKGEEGFSYIDVMIAIVIMLVGVLALASALTANLIRSYETDKKIIAKQYALSTIESIISAKDIARTDAVEGWESVGNVGNNIVDGTAQGIFLNGWTPIREELGWDGVAGTADDGCPEATACNVAGRPPNNSPVVPGFERRIVITDVQDAERPTPPNPITRRRIDVTVRYNVSGIYRNESVATLVTNY